MPEGPVESVIVDEDLKMLAGDSVEKRVDERGEQGRTWLRRLTIVLIVTYLED